METATQKNTTGYKQTEIGILPEDWDVKKLGDIADVIGGGTPSTTVIKYWNGSINWFTPTEIGIEKYVYQSKRKITDEGLKNGSAKILNEGTVLLTSRAGIGNLSILKNKACTNQGFQSLAPKSQTDSEFLYYLMFTKKGDLLDKASGSTFLEISPNNVRSILVQFPTNSEQVAIASALSDTDTLISKLEKLIKKKKNINQGVAQELLTGKRRLLGFSGKWETKSLGDLVDVKDGTHQTPKYVEEGIPFYSVESITRNDFENTKYISYAEHKLLTKNFKIEKGDILMTRIGSIGDCKLITWEPNASFYVSLALLKPKNKLTSPYIYHFSKTKYFKRELEDRSLQWAVPKKINLGEISKVKIYVPVDQKEQTAIANVLSDMDLEIQKLESQFTKYQNIKQGMMQTLLTGKIRLITK